MPSRASVPRAGPGSRLRDASGYSTKKTSETKMSHSTNCHRTSAKREEGSGGGRMNKREKEVYPLWLYSWIIATESLDQGVIEYRG